MLVARDEPLDSLYGAVAAEVSRLRTSTRARSSGASALAGQ